MIRIYVISVLIVVTRERERGVGGGGTLIKKSDDGCLRNIFCPPPPPPPSPSAERFSFYRRSQLVGESVADFVAELRRLARNCQFGDFLDEALRDRLVCGLQNEAIQRRLLTEAKLTFAGALELAKAQEAAELQSYRLSNLRTLTGYKRAMHSLWTKKSSSRSMSVEGLYLSQMR